MDLERLLGPGHPDTLNARNSLAAAYLAAGRAADAIPMFEQTLAVPQRQLGPDHPDTLTSQNNLAMPTMTQAESPRRSSYTRRPGHTRAAAGPRPSRHPEFPRQPRRCLPGGGPGRRGDPAVRADLGQPGTSAGSQSPRYPGHTEETGHGLPGRGPARRGGPTARADLGRPETSTTLRSPRHPRPHGRTSSEAHTAQWTGLPTDPAARQVLRSLPAASRRSGRAEGSGRLPSASRRFSWAAASQPCRTPAG